MVGPTSQQDVELSALYRDSVITYGEGKVLGILATRSNDHEIRKRATNDEQSTQETTSSTPTPTATTQEIEQSNETDFIYYPGDSANYKILLYTSSPPKLFDGTNTTILNGNVPRLVTTDQRGEQRRLIVRYNYVENKVRKIFDILKFIFRCTRKFLIHKFEFELSSLTKKRAFPIIFQLTIVYVFNISGGYWTLIAADVDWPKRITSNNTLYLLDDQPSAPLTFSYQCSRPLIFQNGSISLELANIQVI